MSIFEVTPLQRDLTLLCLDYIDLGEGLELCKNEQERIDVIHRTEQKIDSNVFWQFDLTIDLTKTAINKSKDLGNELLDNATFSNNKPVIEWLIDNNFKGQDGIEILAIKYSSYEVIDLLYNRNIISRDFLFSESEYFGYPMNIAIDSKNKDVIKWLIDKDFKSISENVINTIFTENFDIDIVDILYKNNVITEEDIESAFISEWWKDLSNDFLKWIEDNLSDKMKKEILTSMIDLNPMLKELKIHLKNDVVEKCKYVTKGKVCGKEAYNNSYCKKHLPRP